LSVIDYKTGDYNFIITLGVLKIADKWSCIPWGYGQ
jgi:hypothetical protein